MQTAIWTLNKYNNFDQIYPAIIALYHDVLEDWAEELGVIKKYIFEDTVDHSCNNIAIIRVARTELFRYNPGFQVASNFKNNCLPVIQWCLDRKIKVLLDDAWEIGAMFTDEFGDILKGYWPFIVENNIKILANRPPIEDNYVFDDTIYKSRRDVYIDSNFFIFQTRQQHLNENFRFRMNTYPTLHKDKKYLYTCLFGNIAKRNNAFLYASLLKNNLIGGDSFISTVLRKHDPQERKKSEHDKAYHEIIDWIDNHKDLVYKDRPFDEKDFKSGNVPERRIPQELYDSHFAINVETSQNPWFYTEKTFKYIIAKIPFLSYGGYYFSSGLRRNYGFERFEEIFDYSYEEIFDDPDATRSGNRYRLIEGILENVKRLKKEPVSIFNQPSVREKLDYNESLFYKLTTIDKLKEHFNNIIEAVK